MSIECNQNLMEAVLVAMRDSEKRIGELAVNLGILTNEVKNMTSVFTRDNEDMSKRIERNETRLETLAEKHESLRVQVGAMVTDSKTQRSYLKEFGGWLQWFLILAVAIWQVIKGV